MIVEIFDRYLRGWGFKEIANHFNRPGGPPPPEHVDSARNTAGKWSKTTIRCLLENPVYTGRLFWNRLDFRAVKQGEGPLVRRLREEWIEAEQRHPALIPDELFERTQAEMAARRGGRGNRRRRPQQRFYLLRGIVHCATGHNPLRMQGKERKGITYYTCGYRTAYGDKAAEALGHGRWQYVREDRLTDLVDRFFTTHIFGPQRIANFRAGHAQLQDGLQDDHDDRRDRLASSLADLDQRIQRQLQAIEAGVDPVLVGERIAQLKAERRQTEIALAEIEREQSQHAAVDLDDACAILDALPDLRKPLAAADPPLLRDVYDAFHLAVELDRNKAQIRLKALISSAFAEGTDLEALVANKAIAGAGFEPATFGL